MGGRLRRSAYTRFIQDRHLNRLFEKDHMNRNNYNNFNDDQHAIIDYISDGLWGLCITSRATARAGTVDEILDTDEDLNSLINRSVRTWGVDPRELWVSECARELVSYNLSGCEQMEGD